MRSERLLVGGQRSAAVVLDRRGKLVDRGLPLRIARESGYFGRINHIDRLTNSSILSYGKHPQLLLRMTSPRTLIFFVILSAAKDLARQRVSRQHRRTVVER